MKVFQAVSVDRKIILELREDNDRALAHVLLDPENARTVGEGLIRLADIAEGMAPKDASR
jgi:sulfate adenylyltransferase subunit 1 (EFTu-like GTPase family)